MERIFTMVGAIILLFAVGAGAFGAHALSGYLTEHPDLESTFETAVRYQMIHGLSLFAVAWAVTKWPGTLINGAGYSFVIGIILFSGSLYVLSLTNVRWLGAITPLGGVAFLAGWILFFLAAWRGLS